jgi:hypothetical protein
MPSGLKMLFGVGYATLITAQQPSAMPLLVAVVYNKAMQTDRSTVGR